MCVYGFSGLPREEEADGSQLHRPGDRRPHRRIGDTAGPGIPRLLQARFSETKTIVGNSIGSGESFVENFSRSGEVFGDCGEGGRQERGYHHKREEQIPHAQSNRWKNGKNIAEKGFQQIEDSNGDREVGGLVDEAESHHEDNGTSARVRDGAWQLEDCGKIVFVSKNGRKGENYNFCSLYNSVKEP